MQLYHATNQGNLSDINKEGLRPFSYWTTDEDVLAYYIETIEEEDPRARAIVLTIDLESALQACSKHNTLPQPDFPGIEEPITGALGRKEADIQSDWYASGKTWQDSLEIVKTLRLPIELKAELLFVSTDDDDIVPLNQYAMALKQSKRRQNP